MTDKQLLEKPGVKTTEFWVSTVIVPVFVPLIMILVNTYGFPITEDAVTTIVIAVVTAPVTYILGRIFNKKKIADVEKIKAESTKIALENQKAELEIRNATQKL